MGGCTTINRGFKVFDRWLFRPLDDYVESFIREDERYNVETWGGEFGMGI